MPAFQGLYIFAGDVLFERYIVDFRTVKESVSFVYTNIALGDFILIQNVLILVFHHEVVLVVKWMVFQNIEKIVQRQSIVNHIVDTFYVIAEVFVNKEIKWDELEGILRHIKLLDNLAQAPSTASIVGQAILSVIKDHDVDLLARWVYYFVRVGQFFLNFATQVQKSVFRQVLEKGHSIPNFTIHFLRKLQLEGGRKFAEEWLFFFDIVVALDDSWLFDVVGDFIGNLLVDFVFGDDLVEYFNVTVFLKVVWPYFGDNRSQLVDIIGQNYTADSFNENHAECLVFICWYDVSKAHSKHDRCGPVVGPDVVFDPLLLIYALFDQPACLCLESGKIDQNNRQDMSDGKIKQEHLN
jgi:hypothetical protein